LTYVIIGIIVGSLVYGRMRNAMMCNTIVLANFMIFLLYVFAGGSIYLSTALVEDTGFRGSQLVTGERPYTLLTHLYIHNGVLHILMNMLFLMLMGMPFEQKIGAKKFLFIYFGSGLGAALFSGVFDLALDGRIAFANPETYGVGASGAIFGIMFAFAYRYPREKIPMILFIIFLPSVQVFTAALAYGLIETGYVLSGVADGTGHTAHVGGLITGVLLAHLTMTAELSVRSRKLNRSLLEELAATEELRRIAGHLKDSESEELRDVFRTWLEEWLKKASCPRCGSSLRLGGRRLKCSSCDFSGEFWVSQKRRNEEG